MDATTKKKMKMKKNSIHSPPIEVQFPMLGSSGTAWTTAATASHAATDTTTNALGETTMPDISDDEDDLLENENWNIVSIVATSDDDDDMKREEDDGMRLGMSSILDSTSSSY